MTTVAPPCRNRLAMAFPAPFVPPVTRTRLPPNSLAWFAFVLDAVMAFSSISGPCLRLLIGHLSSNNAIAHAAVGQCSGYCFVALYRLDAATFRRLRDRSRRLHSLVLRRAPVLTEGHGAQTASDTRRPLFPSNLYFIIVSFSESWSSVPRQQAARPSACCGALSRRSASSESPLPLASCCRFSVSYVYLDSDRPVRPTDLYYQTDRFKISVWNCGISDIS